MGILDDFSGRMQVINCTAQENGVVLPVNPWEVVHFSDFSENLPFGKQGQRSAAAEG